jgi:hypothetical protein
MAWQTREACVACGKEHSFCCPSAERPGNLTFWTYICPDTKLLVGFAGQAKLIAVNSPDPDFVELKPLEKQKKTDYVDFYSAEADKKN